MGVQNRSACLDATECSKAIHTHSSSCLQMLVCSLLFTLGGCLATEKHNRDQKIFEESINTVSPEVQDISRPSDSWMMFHKRSRITQGCTGAGCSSCPVDPATCTACSGGYYLSGSACNSCSANCLACTASACSACAGSLVESGSSCICTGSTYQSGTSCPSCATYCTSCSSSTNCNNPQTGYFLQSPSSILPCVSNCNSCSNTIECGNCASGYKRTAGLLCEACGALEYYSGTNTCSACVSPCKTCTSSVSCQSCLPAFKYRPDLKRCDSDCPSGQFWDSAAGACADCLLGCNECALSATAGNCSDFSAPLILDFKTISQRDRAPICTETQ